MPQNLKPYSMIVDFVTGREQPNIGAEENRQAFERFLVNSKGYSKNDIEVDANIDLCILGETYRSQVDLVVSSDAGQTRFMAVKCAAGSLDSRIREILAAARLLDTVQIPLAVVSDGRTAIVLDAVSGKKIGTGLDAIPSKEEARIRLQSTEHVPLPAERRERESLIFRAYDSDNVNVIRKMT